LINLCISLGKGSEKWASFLVSNSENISSMLNYCNSYLTERFPSLPPTH
jgi:hypothetical protein